MEDQDPDMRGGPTIVDTEEDCNTTLDEKILLDKIKKLKNSKSGHIGQLTKLYADIQQVLAEDLVAEEELNGYLDKISVTFRRYQRAHLEYSQCLGTRPDDQIEAMSSYDEQLRRKFELETMINQVLKEHSNRKEQQDFEIRPEDSISRVGSRRNSGSHMSSAASSASSSEIRRVRAKQAVARLKMKQLKQQQELVVREEEMKMKREMLEAQNEIDRADLEARIYEEVTECNEMNEENKSIAGITKLNPRVQGWLPMPQDETSQEKQADPCLTNDIDRLHLTGQPALFTTEEKPTLPIQGVEHARPMPLLETKNEKINLQNLAATIRQGFVLPKPELSKFDGNPLQYWSFIRSFENNIERNASDENEKLTYLVQYCIGEARRVIKSCVTMDPLVGYKTARQLLKERFGHPYMIASSFVKSVTEGAPIKPTDGVELLAFADQLRDCENTLKAIGYLDEINSAAT